MVRKDMVRKDKTYNVFICLRHGNKARYLPTSMYVTRRELTSSFKIKDEQVIERCEEILREYRKRMMSLNLDMNDVDIDTIVSVLSRKNGSGKISFTEWAEEWLRSCGRKGVKNYASAVNALKRFAGRDNVLFAEVNSKLMEAFVDSLKDRPRAQSLYSNAIVKIFSDGLHHYNDEDSGVFVVKNTLSRYTPPKQNVAKKRALDVDTVRRIFALAYDGEEWKGKCSRHDLALDCFRLSFGLMGMNSADLFGATEMAGDEIVYFRAKTRDRRSDNAEMRVRVHPLLKPLVEKYRGSGGHVFNFHERFSSESAFNKALNVGLKDVGHELGVEGLQFYAARHSMATIALNDVGIDKYLVNDMLCHTDPSMRVTDLYIRKSFDPINEANFKLLGYVLGPLSGRFNIILD